MPAAKGSVSHRQSTRKSRRFRPQVAPLLLEIGTEELPASIIKPALQHLERLASNFFEEHRLSHETIQTMGTPRRLVILVDGLSSRQSSMTQEVLGPPQSTAYDAQGQPTQAAQGFAKSQGLPVGKLQVRETSKGTYVCAVKHQEGEQTPEVLRSKLSGMLQQLSFPKSMRWNASRVRFARPLRWIVCLYGSHVVKFEIGGVTAASRTWGHRFLHSTRVGRRQGVEVKSASSYVSTVKRLGIEVDPNERRSIIQNQISTLAKAAKGRIFPDYKEELLEQAVFSVESPQAILGEFNPEYLALPKEVLITSMKEHQGYFSLAGRGGALLPKFIAVTNMALSNMDLIRKGNERVLAARLNDAQYFFQEDRKSQLSDRVEQLQGVVFHRKLGTLHQKTLRIQSLAPLIAEMAGRNDLKEACERAAHLAKADLLTGMVGEFPSLQGVMGREYARCDGESNEVCLALGESYLPRSPEDALPQTQVGIFLALADRLDTLTAFFHIGMVPSGSEDPFGLRRSAYGMMRIIAEHKLQLNLKPLIANAEQLLIDQGVKGESHLSIQMSVIDFVVERFRFYGRTAHGLREDVMDAVLAASQTETCDLDDLLSRMTALQALTAKPEFDSLIVGFKRAHRIVEKEQWTDERVRPELFEHESEPTLHEGVDEVQRVVEECMGKKEYGASLMALLRLKTQIDGFFVGVLVNASDTAIRANRLSLLRRVGQLFLKIADFSRIQTQGG